MPFTPDYPCSNISCRSYGHPHPNCRCAPEQYAQGGSICADGRAHDEACEHFADGGDVQSNQEFAQNPDLAVDHAVMQNGLLHTLSRTGYTKSEEKGRAHTEFLEHHRKGRSAVHSHAESLLEPKHAHHKHDHSKAQALQTKLDELRANPDKALNIGGDLGDTLPVHHAALAAKAGTAMTYLQSIKPQATPGGPLDSALPPSRADEKAYQRQLAIAEDPKLIYQHLKEGTLVPQDLATLSTLYPKLRQAMQDRAFESLANAKAAGKELTHKQKRQLGILLGQPVTVQQTPQAIAAILHANAPTQMPQPAKGPKKATAVELRQINRVNDISETPLQRLQSKGI